MTKEEEEKRLIEIGTAIQGGADPEQFGDELDTLLDTQMDDRDPALEEAWEDSYRDVEE